MTASTAPPAGPDPGVDEPPGGSYTRVSVAGPSTRVDLALPAGLPLVTLLPMIVTMAEQDVAAPHGWALSRLDGTRLDPAGTVAGGGVREGELLVLHPAHDSAGEPLYDDVVEVLAQDAGEAAWTPRDLRRAGALFGALAVLGALWAAAAVGSLLAGILAGVLAVLLLAGAAAVAHAVQDPGAAVGMGLLAAAAGAVGGVVLLGLPAGPPHLMLAAGVVVLVSAAAPPALGSGDAVFIGLGTVGVLTLLGTLLVIVVPTSPARAAAVVAPLALALTTVMPTAALRLSRIPRPPLPRTAADLADVPGQLELELVQQRVARARQLLSGLLIGCYTVTAAGIVLLTADTSAPWPGVLAALLGLLLVLRGRLFRRRIQVAAPIVAAAVALVAGTAAAVTVWAPSTPILLGAVAPVALVVAAVAGVIAVRSSDAPLDAKVARSLDTVETLLLLALVPVVLAVWDVYTTLLELRA